MKFIQTLVIVLCSIPVFSQKTIRKLLRQRSWVQIERFTISLPASYEKETKRNYPILLVLDGEYLFDPFQGALKFGNYWDDLPEMIIVGISQNKKEERYADHVNLMKSPDYLTPREPISLNL